MPPAARIPLQEKFRQYTDARLATYRAFPDVDAVSLEHGRAMKLQDEIWRDAVAASQESPSSMAGMLLLPSLNGMFDITTTRAAAIRMHPPFIIFGLLLALALASALLAGYGMAGSAARSWLHIVGFAAVLGITVYVIMDLELPRVGMIRVDDFDLLVKDVRDRMR